MEIRNAKMLNGLGLFVTKNIKKGEIIFTLVGEIFSSPMRETIHIGDNKHIYDEHGKFINHSFTPNIYIDNTNVVALVDIVADDEVMFNYNETEINMACPFYADNKLVNGYKIKLH
jgi:SET domain-containing protein